MSQSEILEIIQKHKKPISSRQIADELEVNPFYVCNILKKLIKHNEVMFKEIDRLQAKEMFGDKAPVRRLRLYYIG